MTPRDTREAFAAQLVNDAEWQTYAFPPMVLQPNSVVLEPDDPYIQYQNHNLDNVALMRLRVRMYVPLLDNEGNLAQIEDMATGVRRLIIGAGQRCGDLSAPAVSETENGIFLTAYIPVELLTTSPL